MYRMQLVHLFWALLWYILFTCQVDAIDYSITLSHDDYVVLEGSIMFKADLFKHGERPSGVFKYKWKYNALTPHEYETEETLNTTTYLNVDITSEDYAIGTYEIKIMALVRCFAVMWCEAASAHSTFYVTQFLNGDIDIIQSNQTLSGTYVSSASETNMTINIRKNDLDHIMKATSVFVYWFIDCKYYGQTSDLYFLYNFTHPNTSYTMEALVVASYEPLPTTTLPSTTIPTTPPTTISPNITVPNTAVSNITITELITTTVSNSNETSSLIDTTPTPYIDTYNTSAIDVNISLPYICSNSSIIPLDPNKTYGHFVKNINVRAPIMNITVEGTNWIQPWDMLSLNVTCKGSGPFHKCLYFHRGKYNVTGNETCDSEIQLYSCNFSIIHYFLEPSVYTILIILHNDISKQIYPLTINIYKVTTKPQLSVIVVPVSCSLAAIVLIIFGIAYYIQSRARFTVEVADFDFGQNNPEMEYKTFGERLRDSFNNTIRPGSKRISGYKPLNNSQTGQ